MSADRREFVGGEGLRRFTGVSHLFQMGSEHLPAPHDTPGSGSKRQGRSNIPPRPACFYPGLIFSGGFLFENTGLNGKATLRKVELTSGKAALSLHATDLGKNPHATDLEVTPIQRKRFSSPVSCSMPFIKVAPGAGIEPARRQAPRDFSPPKQLSCRFAKHHENLDWVWFRVYSFFTLV